FLLAVGRQACAGDEAHGATLSVIQGRDAVARPESILMIVLMDSGRAPSGASRNDEWKVLRISIRLRQAEHFFGDEAQDKLAANRRNARDQRFPQVALD